MAGTTILQRFTSTGDAGRCLEALDRLRRNPADQLKKSTIAARGTRRRALMCRAQCDNSEETGAL
jgi:hypothetical protein